MNYDIDAASIFLGKRCGFTLYKENKKLVTEIKCYASRVNMKTFTSPEALKADKIFTDFKASMVYEVLLWTILIFL